MVRDGVFCRYGVTPEGDPLDRKRDRTDTAPEGMIIRYCNQFSIEGERWTTVPRDLSSQYPDIHLPIQGEGPVCLPIEQEKEWKKERTERTRGSNTDRNRKKEVDKLIPPFRVQCTMHGEDFKGQGKEKG